MIGDHCHRIRAHERSSSDVTVSWFISKAEFKPKLQVPGRRAESEQPCGVSLVAMGAHWGLQRWTIVARLGCGLLLNVSVMQAHSGPLSSSLTTHSKLWCLDCCAIHFTGLWRQRSLCKVLFLSTLSGHIHRVKIPADYDVCINQNFLSSLGCEIILFSPSPKSQLIAAGPTFSATQSQAKICPQSLVSCAGIVARLQCSKVDWEQWLQDLF